MEQPPTRNLTKLTASLEDSIDDDTLDADYLAQCTEQMRSLSADTRSAHVFHTNFEVIHEQLECNQANLIQTNRVDVASQEPYQAFITNFIPNNCLIYPRRLASEIRFDASILKRIGILH